MQSNEMSREGTLLLIDGNPQDLAMAKGVLLQDFDILIAPSVEAVFGFSRLTRPDLVIMALQTSAEIGLFGQLHALRDASVVFFGPDDREAEVSAYRLGGVGYIRKPYHAELLRQQVRTLYRLVTSISALKDALRRETVLRQNIDVFAYSFQGKRILLAEDVEINQLILANMLQGNHAVLDFAADGAAAVAMFAANPDAYAIILMDIQMPNMDGIAATRAIRGMDAERSKTIPIVALTANLSPGDVREYRRIGMNAVIGKPVDPEQLLRVLIELLAL